MNDSMVMKDKYNWGCCLLSWALVRRVMLINNVDREVNYPLSRRDKVYKYEQGTEVENKQPVVVIKE